MLFQRLRTPIVIIVTLTVLLFIWSQSQQINQDHHNQYLQDLRQVESLQATLNETVLQARLGLLLHYDSINNSVTELNEIREQLGIIPDYINPRGVAALDAQLSSYDDEFAQKVQSVEDFKTQNSVLSNSLSYFIIVVSEFSDRTEVNTTATEIDNIVDGLLQDVLLYDLTSNPELIESIIGRRSALEAQEDRNIADINLDNMISHINIILDRKPLVDNSINTILDAPVIQEVESLFAIYGLYYDNAVWQSQIFQGALYLLSLCLLGYIAISIIVQFRNSALALGKAKTDLEVINSEREEIIYELKKAQEIKDDFMAIMSHELRTPLNAIIGFLGIMDMSQKLDESTLHMVTRARANSERLLNLINDILDISRIESGRFEPVPTSVEVRRLFNTFQSQMEVLAHEKNLDFVISIDNSVPLTIEVDEEALSKIVTNLVGNAFKFTEEGSVRLDVSTHADNWLIKVTDSGVGIPVYMHDTIFERFRQVDGSSTRRYGGSGLGLAIVQKMCSAMNGSISVKSVVGKGSTFTVQLPLTPLVSPVSYEENIT